LRTSPALVFGEARKAPGERSKPEGSQLLEVLEQPLGLEQPMSHRVASGSRTGTAIPRHLPDDSISAGADGIVIARIVPSPE
jgi:hypothetical protein